MGRLLTPLGGESLLLLEFRGSEGVNELFKFDVTAQTQDDAPIDCDKLLGQHVSLRFRTIHNEIRWFDGIVTATRYMGRDQESEAYKLELRPWFWLLSKRRNSRIFSEMSVDQILSQLFGEYNALGRQLFKLTLQQSYPVLEYTVQYRETDLDFARRMMEQHGISFHFDMSIGNHCMVLSDSTGDFEPLEGNSRPFYPVFGQNRAEEEHFSEWGQARAVTTGKVTLRDYNFKTPRENMEVEEEIAPSYDQGGDLISYDYPGKYPAAGDGTPLARRMLDGYRAGDTDFVARGDVLSLAAGQTVTLSEHPDDAMNAEYVALQIQHHYISEGYRTGMRGRQNDEEGYSGRYRLAEIDAPLAPERITPRGVVNGPQTAVVVGSGEIDCDEHGRILVQFHWDIESQKSMRCRVSQSWAGNAWGAVFIPRIGMEVVVEYLDGDPDQPIVTGAVYNGDNKPPFTLPGNKTQSGIKTYSTPGGGGYNSLVFEDKKGGEKIDVHGQKDLTVLIENDETRHIKRHYSGKIDVNSKEEIGGVMALEVGKSRLTKINKSDVLSVKQQLITTAKTKITLKVGGSSIVMDPMSITIKSPQITLDAGMTLTTKAGLKAEHTAGGMMDIKALLVKINS